MMSFMNDNKTPVDKMSVSHSQSDLECQGDGIDNFCKIECELLFDIGFRTDCENICVGFRVIVGVCIDVQQAYCRCHEKRERFFGNFF
jgi:hypothetical protein